MTTLRRIAFLGVAALLALSARAARADVIDGNWCSADGRSFSIKGPEIVTPAGTHSRGSYSRHAFSYVVPAGDPGAGGTVSMVLLNETTVRLWVGANTDAAETWRRCPPPTSAAAGGALNGA